MMDSKPRDFGYLRYQDKYPLELTGSMKRKQRPNTGDSRRNDNINTITFGKNQIQRKQFMDKIMTNYQDFKSIVPYHLGEVEKNSAKKTFQKQNYLGCSGASYLMAKSNGKPDHPEKKHLDSRVLTIESGRQSEKKHYEDKGRESDRQWKPNQRHYGTLDHRIHNDLYSNANRRERAFSSTVRMSDKSMFKEGSKLGYQQEKVKRVSCSKHQEMIGQYYQPIQRVQNKNLRDDWRKSSIVLG